MEQLKKVSKKSVRLIIENLLNETPVSINKLTNGISNFVYEVEMKNGEDLIVRISDVPQRLNSYLKEQWCTEKAIEKGVPVPEILEVGNELIGHPYMVVRKVVGIDGNKFEDPRSLLLQMARYNAIINTIKTTSYGFVFDWSSNKLTKHETWNEFLDKQIKVDERLKMFHDNKIFNYRKFYQLEEHVKELRKIDLAPILTHGDMRLKNLLVDEKGQIISILDWENALSAIPHWDLSIALHDLNSDDKDAYLYEYGFNPSTYREAAPYIKTINLLNYAWAVEKCIETNRLEDLEKIKVKLEGHLDMYSFTDLPRTSNKKGFLSKLFGKE